MKSGPVLTEQRFKWYEPDSWRFGDAQVRLVPSAPSLKHFKAHSLIKAQSRGALQKALTQSCRFGMCSFAAVSLCALRLEP